MKKEALFRYVDHTALKAGTTWSEIQKLCGEALTFRMASVCIPSSYVKLAHDAFFGLKICTVVGFPLGNCSTETKIKEAEHAINDGADEIDMVINLGMVKSGRIDLCEEEIRKMKVAVGNHVLKVIIETCYLTKEEKVQLAKAVTSAGADYIKTSTGFGTGGATLEDVKLLAEHIGEQVQIKASGGVRSREEMEQYIEAGCSRIGTSHALEMLK